MSDGKNENEARDDDEISLIDLCAVLLRYRKIVVGGTLLVAVCAALVLFVLPAVKGRLNSTQASAAAQDEITASYRVRINDIPVYIDKYVSSNFKRAPSVIDFIFDAFNDLAFVGGVNEEYTLWRSDDADTIRDPTAASNTDSDDAHSIGYINFINDLRTSDKLALLLNENKENNAPEKRNSSNPRYNFLNLTVSLSGIPLSVLSPRDDNPDELPAASAFVQAVVFEAERRAQAVLIPLLESIAADGSTVSAIDTRNIETYLSAFNGFYDLTAVPVVSTAVPEQGRSRGVAFVVSCFAAFFVFVFVAFFMNAVANVKKDPDASRLIKTAWEEGGRRKRGSDSKKNS